MSFKRAERLAARNYDDEGERNAYRVAYNEGFQRLPMSETPRRRLYPNAYAAGYWDGHGDSEEPDAK